MPKGSARCRANKAYTALHHGEGVWGFGKDAEIERPKALQDAKPTKRSYRDREFALSYKKQTFSTSWAGGFPPAIFSPLLTF